MGHASVYFQRFFFEAIITVNVKYSIFPISLFSIFLTAHRYVGSDDDVSVSRNLNIQTRIWNLLLPQGMSESSTIFPKQPTSR